MMDSDVPPFLLVILNQGEIDDPEGPPLLFVNELQLLSEMKAEATEHIVGHRGLVGHEQH